MSLILKKTFVFEKIYVFPVEQALNRYSLYNMNRMDPSKNPEVKVS